jgi:hypothetical protein
MSEVLDREDIQERYAAAIEQFNKMMEGIQSEKMGKVELSELEAWLLAEGQELFKRIMQGHDSLRQKEADSANADMMLDTAD